MKKMILITKLLLAIASGSYAQHITPLLDSAIATYVAQNKFTGTVLVVRKGAILLQKGYGWQDAANQQPNTPNTIFEIASLAKPFTAAVILKLQEAGKLSVQDKLSKYYPGYPNGDNITIHQLLSHSSGIFDYTSSKTFRESDQSRQVSIDSMISYFKDVPLLFEPGTKFSYSNSGYTMLGYIIEKVTRRPYRKVLEQLILRPLQLHHSGYDFVNLMSKNKSVGYNVYGPEQYQPAKYVSPSILFTTGALYSTVGDLYKWHQALSGNKFLSAASKKMMYTPVAGPYGYGWFSDSLFGKQRFSHDGNVSGFKANINRIPEDDVCVIALSNSNSSSVGQMVRVLMNILYNRPYQLPVERKSIQLSTDSLQQFAGTYEYGKNIFSTATVKNGRLFFEGTNLSRFELFAETPVSFFAKQMDAKVEFIRDTLSGNFTEVILYFGNQQYRGKKMK